MKAIKKVYEPKLTSIDMDSLSDADLLDFAFNRKSFYRDYKLLHNSDVIKVKNRVGLVLSYVDIYELVREVRLCFKAAILAPSRQTYTFNQYVIGLIELHYSNELFSSNKMEIVENQHLCFYDSQSISFEWVLFSRILTPYQRYLLFEYLVLGYSLEGLAKRRFCTSRTIQNHFNLIVEALDPQKSPDQLQQNR